MAYQILSWLAIAPGETAAVRSDYKNVFFFNRVKQAAVRRLELGPFREKLLALTDEQIRKYADSVPVAWRENNDFCEQIGACLREARERANPLIQFIQHLLR